MVYPSSLLCAIYILTLFQSHVKNISPVCSIFDTGGCGESTSIEKRKMCSRDRAIEKQSEDQSVHLVCRPKKGRFLHSSS